jgi:hypothetical protein
MAWITTAWHCLALAVAVVLLAPQLQRLTPACKEEMTVTKCPVARAAACTCDGTCVTSNCLCPPCIDQALGNMPFAPGGIVSTNGGAGGSTGSAGAGAGGGGGGGGSSGITVSGSGLVSPLSRPLSFAPSRSRPPRPGNAGIEGYDGARASEFEFAAGYVRGLRMWSFPVITALNSALASDLTPSAELLRPPGASLPLLAGMTGRGSWHPGVNEAQCANDSAHAPPVEYDEKKGAECGCGFWAYWNIKDAPDWTSNVMPVAGVIKGTGRVLIGEKGFRCQKAAIVALAPAITIVSGHGYGKDAFGNSYPGGITRDPQGYGYIDAGQRDREMADARTRADAWMAVIMDMLGGLYPDARVFATVRGMTACVPPGEFTQ